MYIFVISFPIRLCAVCWCVSGAQSEGADGAEKSSVYYRAAVGVSSLFLTLKSSMVIKCSTNVGHYFQIKCCVHPCLCPGSLSLSCSCGSELPVKWRWEQAPGKRPALTPAGHFSSTHTKQRLIQQWHRAMSRSHRAVLMGQIQRRIRTTGDCWGTPSLHKLQLIQARYCHKLHHMKHIWIDRVHNTIYICLWFLKSAWQLQWMMNFTFTTESVAVVSISCET